STCTSKQSSSCPDTDSTTFPHSIWSVAKCGQTIRLHLLPSITAVRDQTYCQTLQFENSVGRTAGRDWHLFWCQYMDGHLVGLWATQSNTDGVFCGAFIVANGASVRLLSTIHLVVQQYPQHGATVVHRSVLA